MRVEFPRISKAVEVEEPSVLPFSELTVGSTVDSVLVTPQEKGNIRCAFFAAVYDYCHATATFV